MGASDPCTSGAILSRVRGVRPRSPTIQLWILYPECPTYLFRAQRDLMWKPKKVFRHALVDLTTNLVVYFRRDRIVFSKAAPRERVIDDAPYLFGRKMSKYVRITFSTRALGSPIV